MKFRTLTIVTVGVRNKRLAQLFFPMYLIYALFTSFVLAQETKSAENIPSNFKEAIFAGGCFWCLEPPFDNLKGVISTTSGYAGGHVKNPTYKQVSAGITGHREVLRVIYDPKLVFYKELLGVYWHNVDPLDEGGQFCDRGYQYSAAVFYLDDKQKELAEESRNILAKKAKFDKSNITTEIVAASGFYPAEDYHQDYYKRNPLRYKYYRFQCGRDERLSEVWDKK